jgi:hypothetical protein
MFLAVLGAVLLTSAELQHWPGWCGSRIRPWPPVSGSILLFAAAMTAVTGLCSETGVLR